jgi:hypothetical protein
MGAPVTHWAAVPSLRGRVEEHPLHTLAAPLMDVPEVPLQEAGSAINPRELTPENFIAGAGQQPLTGTSHVLLLDDTWTRGGHAQSATLTLRGAGASTVSVIIIARWLKPSFGANAAFVRYRLQRDYDPSQCPWTDGACP